MPHVIVKLWPGRSEEVKAKLAGEITKAVADVLKYGQNPFRSVLKTSNRRIGPRGFTSRTSSPSSQRFIRSRDTIRIASANQARCRSASTTIAKAAEDWRRLG